MRSSMSTLLLAATLLVAALAAPDFLKKGVDEEVKLDSAATSARKAQAILDETRELCADACGSGVDSSCVPACQTEMFTCMDHDRVTAPEAHTECQDKIAEKFKKFGDEWDATHSLVTRRIATTEEHQEISRQCQAACGEGVDSSCVPRCEIQMYTCLDHASHTEERKECNEKALKTASGFGATWDATHLLAQRKHHVISASQRKAAHFQCKAACGADVDSSCVPSCETEMFACIDYEDRAVHDQCSDEVLDKYRKFAENWLAKPTKTASQALYARLDGKHAVVHFQCKAACGAGVDSSCVPSCESEMFACIDHDKSADREKCSDEVLEKYKQFAANWHLRLKKVKVAKAQGFFTDVEHKAVKAKCADLCGPDSQCVTNCEADFYRCIKETLPGQEDERAKCREEVESKYAH